MVRSKQKNTWVQSIINSVKKILQQKKVVGVILGVLALLCTLAIISFKSTDTSWLYSSTNAHKVSNFLGSFGANFSALAYYMFGVSCWLLIVAAWCTAYELVFYGVWWRALEKYISLMILPFAAAGLFAWYRFELYGLVQPGGLVGHALMSASVRMFDTIGGALFLHALVFICLTLAAPAAALYGANLCWRMICLLTDRQRFLSPLWNFTKQATYIVTRPIVGFAYFVRKALIGSDNILGSDQDVVTFEKLVVDDAQRSGDHVWHEFLSDKVYGSAKKDTRDQAEPVFASSADDGARIVQPTLKVSKPIAQKKKSYVLPDKMLFSRPKRAARDASVMDALKIRAKTLEEKLERFGVTGSVVAIKPGPVVTLFEYQPQIDTKISKIMALEDDLAMALQAMSIRIIAPIPGKSVVGFEVANAKRTDVLFADSLYSSAFQDFSGSIPLILGEDTVGNQVVIDLVKAPHLLVAGSTGSGKSVALNGMLVSMLCKLSPDNLKLILIDPKRLEFAPYKDIPHLLFPIVIDPRRAAPVLAWVVRQMEDRYSAMAECGARNVADYNVLMANEPEKKFPFIVVVIDELADLMMTAGREVEDLIARIAQMARAAGIHMIVATQRPSVDVITGLIKVNFPSRISFRVTSKVDSRTILDCGGADKLLGRGDMLFLDSSSTHIARVHGAYVSDKEISAVVSHVCQQRAVEYLDIQQELTRYEQDGSMEDQDQLMDEVVNFVKTLDEVSISLLQRKFKIGYNRSARIVDTLESKGIIMPSDNGKTRKVIR